MLILFDVEKTCVLLIKYLAIEVDDEQEGHTIVHSKSIHHKALVIPVLKKELGHSHTEGHSL